MREVFLLDQRNELLEADSLTNSEREDLVFSKASLQARQKGSNFFDNAAFDHLVNPAFDAAYQHLVATIEPKNHRIFKYRVTCELQLMTSVTTRKDRPKTV